MQRLLSLSAVALATLALAPAVHAPLRSVKHVLEAPTGLGVKGTVNVAPR